MSELGWEYFQSRNKILDPEHSSSVVTRKDSHPKFSEDGAAENNTQIDEIGEEGISNDNEKKDREID